MEEEKPLPTVPFLDGWHAHRLGVEAKENPFNEREQSYSHLQWMGGWCRRFGAIKHGADTTFLDAVDGYSD